MTEGASPPKVPPPPGHLQGYVEILGVDLTLKLLLELGGSEVYFPTTPQGGGRLEAIVGRENVIALADLSPSLTRRIPTGKKWIAQVLYTRSLPVAEIARRLHMSDKAIRGYVRALDADDRQMRLL